jgi:uncharacterized protein YkwD
MTARILSVIVAATLVAGSSTVVRGGETSTDERRFEERLLEEVDEFRADKGLDPLDENGFIRGEARDHSFFMSERGALSDTGENARAARIEENVNGTDRDQICELRASSGLENVGPSVRRIIKLWRETRRFKRCLLGRDFAVHLAGAGVEDDGSTWWVTFIAARDSDA